MLYKEALIRATIKAQENRLERMKIEIRQLQYQLQDKLEYKSDKKQDALNDYRKSKKRKIKQFIIADISDNVKNLNDVNDVNDISDVNVTIDTNDEEVYLSDDLNDNFTAQLKLIKY